jgi:putative phosphoribosyl transferase
MPMQFRDRHDAGRFLATKLRKYSHENDVVVLGLPRGGVPVAYEVAENLHAPLDIFVVRKLGVPGHEELAMGAIASGGVRVLNDELIDTLGISEKTIDQVAAEELHELERREKLYREGRPAAIVADHTVILIDDGLATGASMRAATIALRQQRPMRIIVAVPVAAAETCELFRDEVDEIVCAMTPEPFHAVGLWYRDFSQTSDEEVTRLLRLVDHEVHHEQPVDSYHH